MNKEMVNELRKKVQFARECKYLIKKQLDPNMQIDESMEKNIQQRAEDESGNYALSTDGAVYFFKENFFRTINKNPFSSKLEDYKKEALAYLESSYPFCFNIELRDSFELMYDDSFGTDMIFYAMCLEASNEKIRGLKDALESKKMKSLPKAEKIDFQEEPSKGRVNIEDIKGSSVPQYNANNLWELLLKIDDKNVRRYIEYIMKNGGLSVNQQQTFSGVALCQDEDDNLFVGEGNHRIITYMALKTIREFVTGKKTKDTTIEATIQKIRIHNKDYEDIVL